MSMPLGFAAVAAAAGAGENENSVMHVNGQKAAAQAAGRVALPYVGNRKSISAHKTQNSPESSTGQGAGARGQGAEWGARHTNISFIYSFILLMTRKANQSRAEQSRAKESKTKSAPRCTQMHRAKG